ncbi:hypothetical protein [Staphylococcus aureus]|uniref:hypothetical protein n=3 Tax=Staphylococcus aureus TaxID=1280 RepID=UPI000DE2FBEA|nr:hypothetical protein [Staphylococcus aureus]HDF6210485.1 hypothetical protein [Staphylococcus aureus]
MIGSHTLKNLNNEEVYVILDYLILGIFVFLIVLIVRTVRINYGNTARRVKNTKTIKHILKFMMIELRTVLIMYTTSIGLYIVIERMLKYRIYPASEKDIYYNLMFIHEIEPNQFVIKVFFALLTMYITLFLPYKLLKLYETIISENNYEDYLQKACNKAFIMVKKLIIKLETDYKKRRKSRINNDKKS